MPPEKTLSLLGLFTGVAGTLQTAMEDRKKEIIAEWERSKNYPRKMKKRIRKELKVDWILANYNPFEL